MVAMLCSKRSRAGEAALIWALRLTGDRHSTPRVHRSAEEKLGDRQEGGAELEKVREGGDSEEEEERVGAKRSVEARKMEDDEVDGEAW